MMETAEDRERDDVAVVGALRWDRGRLAESLVRARGVVVADVLTDDALQVPVIEHQDVVEAFATQRAEKALADVLRVAPLVGLLYSSLVLWFAEGVHHTAIAAPPVRPWYPHKRGLCFHDVLRAARRALDGAEVLDPRRLSDNLQQSSAASRPPERRRVVMAA